MVLKKGQQQLTTASSVMRLRYFLTRHLSFSFFFRYVLMLLLAFLLSGSLIFVLRRLSPPPPTPSLPLSIPWQGDADGAVCRLPPLPVDSPELRHLFHDVPPIRCEDEPAWVIARGHQMMVTEAAERKHGKVECQFKDLLRESDQKTTEGISSEPATRYTPKASDYVRATCSAKDGKKWSNFIAGVRSNAAPHAVPLSKLPKDNLPVNILIWGFDSLSRNTFLRKLPKTAKFLEDTLEAVVLKGYNIVGDGTPQALIPILTGRTEPELPEVRKRIKGSGWVNTYPFAWRDFERDGYVTAFLEDCPKIGTFQYRLNGFDRQPTTHYMRTFYLAAEKAYGDSKKLCLRDTPRHKVMMDQVESLFEAYHDRAKFVFGFHGELSHDDVNLVGAADDDMVAFLRRLWRSGALNNTALAVMADHGHRFTDVRNTQQGKLEERLPFWAWALPGWVRRQHPEAVAALRVNADRLTTPFDQYWTLQHLRHWPAGPSPDPAGRGVSLLSPGTPDRGCSAAGVEAHWCACLRWRSVDIEDPRVRAAATAFETYVNELQEKEAPGLCAPLMVLEVSRAEELEPQQHMLQFVKSSDADGFKADLSGNGTPTQRLLQLRIRAAPESRMFEATIVMDDEKESFIVRHEDISRTDKYGNQARCVMDRMDHMRKLCFCRD